MAASESDAVMPERRRPWRRRALLAGAGLALLAPLGCGTGRSLAIGVLAGLSGHDEPNADDGRNGVMLAVEQRNAAGGLRGRTLALLVRDDGASADAALHAVQALIDAKVVAIIGPFASSAVRAVQARVNTAQLLTLSPTVASGVAQTPQDYLLRLGPDAADSGAAFARLVHARGWRRIALALARDARVSRYASRWRDAFMATLQGTGIRVLTEVGYDASEPRPLGAVMRELLAQRPEAVVLTGGTVDVARLAQQARKQAPGLPLVATESAANAALIELGGRAVEGLISAHWFDEQDEAAPFRQFVADYRARFGREAGYAGMAAYEAATVVLQALAQQHAGEPLRDAVQRLSPYRGLQRPLVLDGARAAPRPLHFVTVRAGRFERLT